jgi:hypothetical protein
VAGFALQRMLSARSMMSWFNSRLARAVSFNIDSATCFNPKFAYGVVERTAAGGIVRDDKAVASINANREAGIPTWIMTRVNQELLALHGDQYVTKPG